MKCIKCKKSKKRDEMSFNRGNIQRKCLECCRLEAKIRYEKNRVTRIAKAKQYVTNNSEKVKVYQKQYNRKNRDKTAAYNKSYRQNNAEAIREYKREYRTRPHAKMRDTLHKRLYKLLKAKDITKTLHTIPLLGIRLQTFLIWIEFQFDPYMSWENYGSYWHIDHCKPCESLDLFQESEQRECFHWTNMQPMEGIENISKGTNYTSWDLLQQEIKVKAFKFYLRAKFRAFVYGNT